MRSIWTMSKRKIMRIVSYPVWTILFLMSRKLDSFESRKKCCQEEKRRTFPKNMVLTVTNETVHSCNSIPEHSSSKHGNACESWHTLDMCHLPESEAFIISDTLKNNRAKHKSFPAAFPQKELDLRKHW